MKHSVGKVTAKAQIPLLQDRVRLERVRALRRRMVLRRGALIHSGMHDPSSSLAMLDEAGVVVSWYGRSHGGPQEDDLVVDRHVSQFYVAEDLANDQPNRDMQAARVEGSSMRQGWQRRPDGLAFWGTARIEAIQLRSGRLQGFSYLTRQLEGPPAIFPSAQNAERAQSCAIADGRPALILPAWDRMARARKAERQRRLLRLASRNGRPSTTAVIERCSDRACA
jgi:hypothetical protein